jgi:hypothetical protein
MTRNSRTTTAESAGTAAPPARRADLVSLVFGILFLAVAGWWAASYFLDVTWTLDWDLPDLGWFAAGALILLGLIGILASLRRDKPAPEAVPAAAPPPTAPPPALPAPDEDRPPTSTSP